MQHSEDHAAGALTRTRNAAQRMSEAFSKMQHTSGTSDVADKAGCRATFPCLINTGESDGNKPPTDQRP